MKNKEFSLLVTITPPFTLEGKTSDMFQTYPNSIIANICFGINTVLYFLYNLDKNTNLCYHVYR